MNRGNSFRRNVFAAFVVLGMLFAAVVGATVKLYTVSAEDYPSEVESMDISKQRALEKAVKKAKKEAGVYLKTYSRSVNSELTDDEIIAITSNSYKIVGEPKFTREIVNHSDETSIIVWKVNVDVQVDDSEIQSWLKRDDKEKSTIISQTREINKASDENERQIEDLREKYNRATSQVEKDKIIKQMNDTDREFLANQKVEEAEKLYYAKDYNGAIKLYNEAIKLNINNSLAYYVRGSAYDELKQYEIAIKDYDKAIQLNPNYAEAYNNRGFAYNNLGQYELAIQDCNMAIKLNQNLAEAYNNRGNAYNELGKYELAIFDLNKAIQLNPNLSVAYNNRGLAYSYIEKYDRALVDLDKAIQLNPNLFIAYNNRGIVHVALKQYELAIFDFDKAIQFNVDNVLTYLFRSLCYQQLGYTAKAQADFAKAKELGYNG